MASTVGVVLLRIRFVPISADLLPLEARSLLLGSWRTAGLPGLGLLRLYPRSGLGLCYPMSAIEAAPSGTACDVCRGTLLLAAETSGRFSSSICCLARGSVRQWGLHRILVHARNPSLVFRTIAGHMGFEYSTV
jgi:hypothetical protein